MLNLDFNNFVVDILPEVLSTNLFELENEFVGNKLYRLKSTSYFLCIDSVTNRYYWMLLDLSGENLRINTNVSFEYLLSDNIQSEIKNGLYYFIHVFSHVK